MGKLQSSATVAPILLLCPACGVQVQTGRGSRVGGAVGKAPSPMQRQPRGSPGRMWQLMGLACVVSCLLGIHVERPHAPCHADGQDGLLSSAPAFHDAGVDVDAGAVHEPTLWDIRLGNPRKLALRVGVCAPDVSARPEGWCRASRAGSGAAQGTGEGETGCARFKKDPDPEPLPSTKGTGQAYVGVPSNLLLPSGSVDDTPTYQNMRTSPPTTSHGETLNLCSEAPRAVDGDHFRRPSTPCPRTPAPRLPRCEIPM
ncbi:hypothetical protein JHW43_005831 [Diplocarpon mali]|nr:hypothetical protein JHW43_005831 [Diplocarpon mali]